MNLFNEVMNVAKKQAMSIYHASEGNSKEQKLRGQLHHCTYTDDTKFVIQKAVKQVFHVYPFFDTNILSFTQNNQQRRFIQIQGILQIQVRGKTCKVDYNVMIPNGFPKKPPYVRIINRNIEYIVDEFYKSVQSPSDQKSYILNEKLNEVKYWDPSKSIVNVIIESHDLMRNRFPFSKPGNKNSVFGGNQGFNNNNQWNTNSPWQQGGQNQGLYNNQGFNNYTNQQGYNNNGYNNNMMGGMGGIGGFNNINNNIKQPPIPFNQTNITQTIANGQKFAGSTRKVLQKMKAEHLKTLQKIQTLDILKYSIQSEQNYLRKQNREMITFLNSNQDKSAQNLVDLVKPKDDLSDQILNLVSSIKARQECTTQLQMRFNGSQIGIDQFLKHLRKTEETKFEQKVLLSKCISASKKY